MDPNYKRNLIALDKVICRASRPGYWGSVTLQFENGKMRSNVEIRSTLRITEDTFEGLDETLDAAMVEDKNKET